MYNIVGQEFIREAFERSFENNKISHSYIVVGPDGSGKSIFALYMSSILLCTGRHKPCGGCSACLKIKNGNHPDLKIVSGLEKSIGVDSIRDIIDDIYTKPYEGDRKVVIIKGADNITLQGQNAILKTLEEPPKDTTIIMLMENINAILSTIQSRCQILRFGRVSTDKIKDYLRSSGYDEETSKMASSLSDGVVGRALRFLDEKYMKLRVDTIEIGKSLLKSKAIDMERLVDFFMKNKDKIYDILDILTTWYRDIILLKHSRDRNLIINVDLYEMLVEESQLVSYNKLNGIVDVIKETREKLRQNSNFQLTMEVMVLNIQEV